MGSLDQLVEEECTRRFSACWSQKMRSALREDEGGFGAEFCTRYLIIDGLSVWIVMGVEGDTELRIKMRAKTSARWRDC